MKRFRERAKRDQSGATLLEVVIAVALFFVIGSGFVYALNAVGKVSGTSNDKAKSSMSQSGISALFQDDIRNAKAVTRSTGNTLYVARTDGTCVTWNINRIPGNIGRATATGKPAPTPTTYLQEGVKAGSFIISGNSVKVNVSYTNGADSFVDTAPLNVADSDGSVCWP